MTRPLLLALALAVAATISVVAPTVASPAAEPSAPLAFIEFDIPANHGLKAHLESDSEGVELELTRGNRIVSYTVQGESTQAGLKARFGKLGVIDVSFTPTSTHLEESPKSCEGPPSTDSEGVFSGTIEFTGERRYVRIDQSQVEGRLSVSREGEWRCPTHKPPAHPHVVGLLGRVIGQGPVSEKEPASLYAVSPGCHCIFLAYTLRDRRGRGRTTFLGVTFEKLQGMEIERGTFAGGRPPTFVFDHQAGTARLRPPAPFSGTGTFERRPHARDLWRSSIRVPLLGAGPFRVGGAGSQAVLVRGVPGGD
jgi:hypothetical protein